MQGHEPQLYAVLRDGALNRYPEVEVLREDDMPSGGALSNPNDAESVKGLEDTMIEAYGNSIVATKCKAGGKTVDLSAKMIRPVHVDALARAVDEFKVESLNLRQNQLGAEGAKKLAGMLAVNRTLTSIKCAASPTTASTVCTP